MTSNFHQRCKSIKRSDSIKKILKILLTSAKFAKNAFSAKNADVSKNFEIFFIKSLPFIDLHFWWKFEVQSLFLLKVIQIFLSMTSSKWGKIGVFPRFFEFRASWTLWPCPILFSISIRFEKTQKTLMLRGGTSCDHLWVP